MFRLDASLIQATHLSPAPVHSSFHSVLFPTLSQLLYSRFPQVLSLILCQIPGLGSKDSAGFGSKDSAGWFLGRTSARPPILDSHQRLTQYSVTNQVFRLLLKRLCINCAGVSVMSMALQRVPLPLVNSLSNTAPIMIFFIEAYFYQV